MGAALVGKAKETEAMKVMEEAIKNMREPLPMEPELWAAGADHETAHFVARMLRQKGYYLVRPDDLDWDDIDRFKAEIRKGQDVREDGGGFWVRCLKALMRIKTDPVVTHQQALKAMLDPANTNSPNAPTELPIEG